MKSATSKFRKFNREILVLVPVVSLAIVLATVRGRAQNCSLPSFPTSSITTTQDRDQMMCQQGLTFPILPVRSGTAWPWNDPSAPTNARPSTLTNPEGNWTDPQGHTIVRTAWGNWHTYDADPVYEPNPSQHYNSGSTTWPFPSLNGGAMSGYGDYGPESNPRYPDIDLFKMKDGMPVASREDWWIKRRPEIFNLVQQEFYGRKWDASEWPAITWSVGAITTGTQNGVAYRQKTITGTISKTSYPALRNTPVITLQCRTPAAKAGTKVPVFIQNGGSATTVFGFTATAGFGGCGYSNAALQPDSGGANLSSYIIGLVNKGNWRKPDDPGALVAWAWGISRLVDYFATDPDIDEDKVAVEGHSRYGKATLVAAAYDDRIVAAFPSCGGSMGTSWARRAYGETLDFVSGSTSEYHWLNGKVMNYAGPITPGVPFPRKVQFLDVDVHSVMSLIAPRAVMTNGGSDTPAGNGDAWQDPRGMFLAGKYSGPVWEFLGWAGQVIPPGTVFTSPGSPGTGLTAGPAESTRGTPPFNVAFINGTVGWRRHSEGHTDTPDWPTFVTFATKYLNDKRPVITAGQSFTVPDVPATAIGTIVGTDGDAADTLRSWQVTGGNGAYIFQLDPNTGQITVPDRSKLGAQTQTYNLIVMVGDGKLPSHTQAITINVPTDTAAPVTTAAAAPAPNANGWNKEDVVVTLDANDIGVAGVKEISTTLAGAQTGSNVTTGNSTQVAVSTEGTTTLSYFATDNFGNAGAPQTIEIKIDKTAPTLVLANQSAEATGPGGAVVTLSASATDKLDPNVPVGLSIPSESQFPLGTTTVDATATDQAGNTTTGSFTVTVQDTTAPVITLPANQTLEATSGAGAVATFSASAEDIVSGNVAVSFNHASGSTFALGTTTVTASATDAAGNNATGSFTVTVRDTTAPVLTVPANQILEATSPAGAVGSYSATAHDVVSGNIPVSFSPSSGTTFPLGTTTVTANVTDQAGNSASGSFTVTVRDTTAPIVSCPAPLTANENPSTCQAQIPNLVPGVVATDNYTPSGSLIITQSVVAGIQVGGGAYPITITVKDAAGNSSSCTTVFTVVDATAPTITMDNGQHMNWAPANHNYETVYLTNFVVSADDSCDPTVIRNSVYISKVTSDEAENGPGSGNTLNDIVIAADCKSVKLRNEREDGGNGRVYTITFKVKDAAGNFATNTAKIYVPKSQNQDGAVDSGPHYTVTSACP